MENRRINFGAYRTGEMLQMLVYHFDLRGSNGDVLRRRGPCPICSPEDPGSRHFAVDLKLGVWYCHKCKCSGTALTLYSLVTGLKVYDAAVDLSRLANEPVPCLGTVLPDVSQDLTELQRHDTGLANRNNNVASPRTESNAELPSVHHPRSRHVT